MAIVVGSVAVEVVPSAAGFRQALAAQLRDLKVEVDVDVDLARALAEIESLRALLDNIGDIDIDVDTDIDLAGARAEIEALRQLLNANTPEIDIPVHVDRGGHALRQTGLLTARMRAMVTAALSLGPALIPLGAALAAIFGGLMVPIVAATAGIGAFAVFAIPTISKVTKASNELAAAQSKVDSALTSKQRETALAKQKQLLESLDPATRAAVVSLNNLKTTFKNFQRSLQPAIFEAFNAGLRVANAALPLLATLARAVAPILTELGNRLAVALASPEARRFVAFLTAQAGPAIRGFATVLGNLVEGFGNLLEAFAPLAPRMMAGLVRMSEGFARLGKSDSFRRFLDYAISTLPKVAAFMGALGSALGGLLSAFAPFGDFILGVLTNLLKTIALLANNAPVLTVALVLLGGAFLLFGTTAAAVVLGIGAIIAALKYLYDHSAPVRAVIADLREVLLNLAEKALPVVREAFAKAMEGIRTGIEYIGDAIKQNRPQIDQLLGGLKRIGEFMIAYVLPYIGPAVAALFITLGLVIAGTIQAIANTVTVVTRVFEAFKTVGGAVMSAWNTITGAVSSAWAWITSTVTAGVTNVIGAVRILWAQVTTIFMAGVGVVRGVWNSFWNSGLGQLVSAVIGLVVAVVKLGWAAMVASFQISIGAILSIVRIGFNGVRTTITTVINTVRSMISVVLNAIRALWSSTWNAVAAVAAAIWGRIGGSVTGGVNTTMSAVGRIRAVAGIIGGAFSAAYSAASSAIGRLVSLAAGIAGRVRSAVGNLGGLLVSAGRSLIDGLISGITQRIGALTAKVSSLTSLIKDNKGPPDYDRVLLTPAGRLIMQGLIRGIADEEPALVDKLRSISSTIGGLSSAVAATVGVAGGGTAQADSAAREVHFHARTVDINERNLTDHLHALDLRERVGRPR